MKKFIHSNLNNLATFASFTVAVGCSDATNITNNHGNEENFDSIVPPIIQLDPCKPHSVGLDDIDPILACVSELTKIALKEKSGLGNKDYMTQEIKYGPNLVCYSGIVLGNALDAGCFWNATDQCGASNRLALSELNLLINDVALGVCSSNDETNAASNDPEQFFCSVGVNYGPIHGENNQLHLPANNLWHASKLEPLCEENPNAQKVWEDLQNQSENSRQLPFGSTFYFREFSDL